MPRLRELFDALEEAAASYIASESQQAAPVLSSIFRLNNEVGRLYRSSLGSGLRDLQLALNEVTKAAKSGDRTLLRQSMERARRSFVALEGTRES